MALHIQKLRESIFQCLYSMDFHETDDQELLYVVMQELKITKKNALQALETAKKIHKNKQQIDELLKQKVASYDIDRIHSVERNILRLALYECVIEKALPIEIAISEAKRLLKKFSNREAEAFIQAILDAIYKQECGADHVSSVQEG